MQPYRSTFIANRTPFLWHVAHIQVIDIRVQTFSSEKLNFRYTFKVRKFEYSEAFKVDGVTIGILRDSRRANYLDFQKCFEARKFKFRDYPSAKLKNWDGYFIILDNGQVTLDSGALWITLKYSRAL